MVKIDKLKLRNFKSFKTVEIPLAEGYTTIVGSNGSGKSNIVDSFCFVLGTSSMKNLRADRLTDLVNHNAKEPIARVDLEIRNGKENHSVSRAIDKTGNSVFRLNGKRTTRAQLEEFLHSMSIVPDGHNIIMQGDVTAVVKMTPLQRRGIIDEVSGIAEYEAKKDEALRELGKVEEKIKEADIVLSERKGYLDVLEKEKKEAERYRDLQENHKQYQASAVKLELDSTQKTYETTLEFIEKNKVKIDEKVQRRGEAEQELDDIDKEYDRMMERIFKESSERQKGINQEVEVLKSGIAVLEEKIKSMKELGDKNSAKRQEFSQKISGIGNEVKEKEKKLDTLILEEDECKKQLKEMRAELDAEVMKATHVDKALEDKYRRFDELTTEIDKLKEDLHKLDVDIKSIQEREKLKKANIESKGMEIEEFKEKQKQIQDKIKEFEERTTRLRKEVGSRETELNKLYEEEKALNTQLQKTDNVLSKKLEELSALDSKISIMKNIAGKSKAVEAVIKKGLPGVLGTVSDLCSYSVDHAMALETSAGPRMYYIITDTAANATNALKYLKNNKLGRATFIPLDKIKSPEKSKDFNEILKHPKAVNLAINLLEFDAKHKKAFEFVFSDTIIVQDIDGAKDIGIGKIRMVTLDGDLCESSGVITGGFSQKGVSIAELKLLDSLTEETRSMSNDKREIVRKLEGMREKAQAMRDDKLEFDLQLKAAEVSLLEWKERLKEYEVTEKEGSSLSVQAKKEIKQMEQIIDEKIKKKQEVEQKVSLMIQERQDLKKVFEQPEVKKYDEIIKHLQEEIRGITEKREDASVQINTLRGEIEKVLLVNRGSLEKEIDTMKVESKSISEQLDSFSSERNQLFKALKEKEAKARELGSSMTDLYQEKEEVEKKRKNAGIKIGRIAREIDKLKEDINEKSVERARLEAHLEELEREWKKCDGKVEIIKKPLGELKRLVAETSGAIAQMGYVNMKALEMYEKTANEVEDITKKGKKLGKEKEAIMNMMDEIEKKKITSFMETFNALNTYFNQYFCEFYPEKGSRAGLKLADPSKPLDSGLILEASPAGKKIKSIDSMSGGEKSVTALAFIFAIQAYRPSPFYILDEADAALDKENSERVARMLKKFSSSLQFIIITHNATVVRNSDQVIGVHLGKDGSSVVEVDLKSYAEREIKAK